MKDNSHQIQRLQIITDERELRAHCRKVSKWKGLRQGSKLIQFIINNEIDCVGLAAPQVGIKDRVFVIFDGKEFAIFVNPRIIEYGAMQDTQVEGCISIPDRKFRVKRPTSVLVKDAVRTEPFELTDMVARVYQHEFDHLKGILISDIGEEVAADDDTSYRVL
jgi:peptide deformylase